MKKVVLITITILINLLAVSAQESYYPAFTIEKYKEKIIKYIEDEKLTLNSDEKPYGTDFSSNKITRIKSIDFVKYGKIYSNENKYKRLKNAFFDVTVIADISFINDDCKLVTFENQEFEFPVHYEVLDYKGYYGKESLILRPKNISKRIYRKSYENKSGFSSGKAIRDYDYEDKFYGTRRSFYIFEEDYLQRSVGDKNNCNNYIGFLKYYDNEDNLIAKINYNGEYRPDGKAIYYKNNKKFGEGQFNKGDVSGIWTFYNADGSIHSKYDLTDGPALIETITPSKTISERKEKYENGNYRLHTTRELIIFPHKPEYYYKEPGDRTYYKLYNKYYRLEKVQNDFPFIVFTDEDPISQVYNSKNQLLNVGHLRVYKEKTNPYGYTRHYHLKTGKLGAIIEYYRSSPQTSGKVISVFDLDGNQTVTRGKGVFTWFDKNGNEIESIPDFASEVYNSEDDKKHEKAIKAIMKVENGN